MYTIGHAEAANRDIFRKLSHEPAVLMDNKSSNARTARFMKLICTLFDINKQKKKTYAFPKH